MIFKYKCPKCAKPNETISHEVGLKKAKCGWCKAKLVLEYGETTRSVLDLISVTGE